MTNEERIERLEKTVEQLLDALMRKDTEQDGNWGYKAFAQEVKELLWGMRGS